MFGSGSSPIIVTWTSRDQPRHVSYGESEPFCWWRLGSVATSTRPRLPLVPERARASLADASWCWKVCDIDQSDSAVSIDQWLTTTTATPFRRHRLHCRLSLRRSDGRIAEAAAPPATCPHSGSSTLVLQILPSPDRAETSSAHDHARPLWQLEIAGPAETPQCPACVPQRRMRR